MSQNKGKEELGGNCQVRLGFFQLVRRTVLIFEFTLELTLSIIFKEKQLCGSKHAVLECKCLKA